MVRHSLSAALVLALALGGLPVASAGVETDCLQIGEPYGSEESWFERWARGRPVETDDGYYGGGQFWAYFPPKTPDAVLGSTIVPGTAMCRIDDVLRCQNQFAFDVEGFVGCM